MTQLEILKQDLAALTERVNSVLTTNEDLVTLTREQLKAFALAVQSQTIDRVKEEITDINLCVEDEISIDLNGLELEIYVDKNSILEQITHEIDYTKDITDEDIQSFLNTGLKE